MARLLILLFWGAILYLLWNLFFSSSSRRQNREDHDQAIDTMVHDPNCNTFIPRKTAFRKRVAGKEHYFCSKNCLHEYREKIKS